MQVAVMSDYKSSVLDPSVIPQIALESMNETHREEVDIINQLGDLLQQANKGHPVLLEISEKLQEWVRHTREHFDGENKLMIDYNFPAYSFHSEEHKRVMAQIEALQQQWLENNELEPLRNFVFSDWPRWFNDHVNSMDMVTAAFLSKKIR